MAAGSSTRNSAHPFENPTPLSNFSEIVSIFAISSGLTYTLGRMTGVQRHGWAVWGAMAFLFLAGVTTAYWAEARGNPLLAGADQHVSALQSRRQHGRERSAVWNRQFGAVRNRDHRRELRGGQWHARFLHASRRHGPADQYHARRVIVFGGVGAGLYGVVVFVILAVFIAGLMVGRTPEYLGKKIEAYDVQMAMLSILVMTFAILGFSAFSVVEPFGTSSISNAGPHGLRRFSTPTSRPWAITARPSRV